MKLSHSKLSTILNCPMTYYLQYIEGISPIVEKSALSIGSAVHWGIEHNTENLEEYFHSEESAYERDQLLSEAMVHGYLKQKDRIFNQLLTYKDEKLNLIEEYHEVYLTANIDDNEFVGIIDLLLLTDKGFIIIDYKTSSTEPDWNNYMDQIYRYIYLVNCEFPGIPVIKIGIINLKKTQIRQKKTENNIEFLNRLRWEYEIADDSYIKYYEYAYESLEEQRIKDYIENLKIMCKTANTIDSQKLFFINYSAATGIYGKSQYWDIFYKTPDAYLLYKINDKDIVDGEIVDTRPCVPIDMDVVEKRNVMNHFEKYSDIRSNLADGDEEITNKYIKANFAYDEELLKKYSAIYEKNLSNISK